jgi:hypothetical protein
MSRGSSSIKKRSAARQGPPKRQPTKQNPNGLSDAQMKKMHDLAIGIDKTYFEHATDNIDLALKFKRNYRINFSKGEEDIMRLKLKGKYAHLPEDQQILIKEAMGEFAKAISECLASRTDVELKATGQHETAEALNKLCSNDNAA